MADFYLVPRGTVYVISFAYLISSSRGLNASKSVTRQLEIDSRRMEERLRELKVAMNREKEERESVSKRSLLWIHVRNH